MYFEQKDFSPMVWILLWISKEYLNLHLSELADFILPRSVCEFRDNFSIIQQLLYNVNLEVTLEKMQ